MRTRRSSKKPEPRSAVKRRLEAEAKEAFVMERENYVDKQKGMKDRMDHIFLDKSIKFKNKKQKLLYSSIVENQITFVKGSAGTGKTLISIKAALTLLKKKDNEFNKIILTKPIVEAGESVGFLPGDIDSKIDPYMDSFNSNFYMLIGKANTKDLIGSDIIQSAPIPYLRGRTFNNAIAILDEAQNTTITAMKLFLSRKHETTKLVVIGDGDQTDLSLRRDQSDGLNDAFTRLNDIDSIGFIEFEEDDIVRSKILIDIMKRYKD